MVTLDRGQLEDKELDGWGVSWWRGPAGTKWGQMWQVPEHKRKPRYGAGVVTKWRTLAKTMFVLR